MLFQISRQVMLVQIQPQILQQMQQQVRKLHLILTQQVPPLSQMAK